jgi:hypothetical protein
VQQRCIIAVMSLLKKPQTEIQRGLQKLILPTPTCWL